MDSTLLSAEFLQTLLKFLICVVVNFIIVDRLYYQKSHRRDFYFTFMLMTVAIYFLVYSMIFVLEDMKGKTGIGIGIGLFGIFSIMRYRTDAMPVREMTYLFSIICLSVINALGCAISLAESLIPNLFVLLAMFLCERFLLNSPEQSKLVLYDRIKLITPERREELIADLHERLGLDVTSVTVGSVDFLKDTAILRVYYREQSDKDPINDTIKIKRDEWQETN